MRKNYNKAVDMYREGIINGCNKSLIALGDLYLEGVPYILKQDYTRAMDLYERAGDNGNFEGYIKLSDIYLEGKIIKKDVKFAIELLKKAKQYERLEKLEYHRYENEDKKNEMSDNKNLEKSVIDKINSIIL